MNYDNSLVTLEGFDHLYSFFSSKIDSKLVETVLESVFLDRKIEGPLARYKDGKTKALRKSQQIRNMIAMLNSLCENPEKILEIGSATGKMTAEIAKVLEPTKILGVEIKEENVFRAMRDFEDRPNLSFVSVDAFSFMPDDRPDATLCLHGCGSLTDRVLDIALSSSSTVLCAPCCYGLLEKENEQREGYRLPRSRTLKKRESEFKKILARASHLEGSGISYHPNIRQIYHDLILVLVNFDRVFYLRERGYEAGLVRLTTKVGRDINNITYLNSPHSLAIMGRPA
ncbi:MAG: methyltransferase [Nanoarchaeota archaeon]|nr:methyltransferase [Nanoarchaeota archaeon]